MNNWQTAQATQASTRLDAHTMYVVHLPYFDGFQTKCRCGDFESDPMPTRPEAIRLHTIHLANIGIYA